MKIIVVSWLKGAPVLEHIKGYAGIERMVSTMTREFIRQGHKVVLIAPKGSYIEGATTIETNDFAVAHKYISGSDFDIVWDNSCWSVDSPVRRLNDRQFVTTTHVNDAIGWSKNVVYLSHSQRIAHGDQVNKPLHDSPVIYVPIDPNLKPRGLPRLDYLFFIGIVIPYKGVLEAAYLAENLGWKLKVAGPASGDYFAEVLKVPSVEYVGIVDGQTKNDLLEQAFAVCCLHNDGGMGWREPGCGVVGEAFAFNTPVIAFPNGCLKELIKPCVNGWLDTTIDGLIKQMSNCPILADNFYTHEFDVQYIAQEYIRLFEKVMNGETWG